jgi:hypothetical protein
MSFSSLIVGIDLGTTHCAVASVNPEHEARARIADFPIPQLIRPGEVAARSLLPSFLYFPLPGEFPPHSLALPWAEGDGPIAGELARWQGARVPGRLLSSAKSWLCHPGTDRLAKILPWGSGVDVPKMSPVEAQAELLSHLARAWDAANPDRPLRDQEVVLTVPASFDDAARSLTVSAAQRAGLGRFTLLEEPQAALYHFASEHRENLSQALGSARLVLVVDVGGGTTDFTLVKVEASPEGPSLSRIAVGEHLLLGGDNMDAAIAQRLEGRLSPEGRLSADDYGLLLQASRAVKESLLSDGAKETYSVALPKRGSRLLGGGIARAEISKGEILEIVLEGFFPRVSPEERVKRPVRGALRQLGLPYAEDAGITRQLSEFLRQHAKAAEQIVGGGREVPRPDALLLNGGVFASPALRARLLEALAPLWPGSEPPALLPTSSLDLAVARGAAYFGLSKRGLGRKIGGGAARAYYLGLGGSDGQAVCLIPRGFEEGQTASLTERTFRLSLEKPVRFPLFATTADRVDVPGDVVTVEPDTFVSLPPIHTLLSSGKKAAELPVHIEASLTEIGTLQLYCKSAETQERWRLEFEVRGTSGMEPMSRTEPLPARFGEAGELIARAYGNKPLDVSPKDTKQLLRNMEKVLGPKEGWGLPLLREIWGQLFASAAKRRRSADHERIFFHLSGYALRPGWGYPLDGWRCERLFSLFKDGVTFHAEKAVWQEFWIMWRRIAGGLSPEAQAALWEYMKPFLERRLGPPSDAAKAKPKGIVPEGTEEMVRAAASLEHLAVREKEALGGWISSRLSLPGEDKGAWAWALGRIGSRVPLYGSAHLVVPPDTAERWISSLLDRGLSAIDGASFAVAQLARLTEDRARDISEALRQRVAAELLKARAKDSWEDMVRKAVPLSRSDELRAFGDTLPSGLTLAS